VIARVLCVWATVFPKNQHHPTRVRQLPTLEQYS